MVAKNQIKISKITSPQNAKSFSLLIYSWEEVARMIMETQIAPFIQKILHTSFMLATGITGTDTTAMSVLSSRTILSSATTSFRADKTDVQIRDGTHSS